MEETIPKNNAQEIDITVVVTCYNEEDLIFATLENVTAAIQAVGICYEVIVVDDASQDHSVERIREYIQQHPQQPIFLKVNQSNRGLAQNYVEAAFLGRGKHYRLCCGDDAESKDVLVNIFKYVGRADIVIPYQIQSEIAGKSPLRKILSSIYTCLVNLIGGYHIRYYNGLAIHLRYNVMRWHPSSYGFGFQADITTRLLDEGMSYLQVPSSSTDRKGTASSALDLRNILSVGHTLLEIAIRRLRRALYGRTMTPPREILLSEDDRRPQSAARGRPR